MKDAIRPKCVATLLRKILMSETSDYLKQMLLLTINDKIV